MFQFNALWHCYLEYTFWLRPYNCRLEDMQKFFHLLSSLDTSLGMINSVFPFGSRERFLISSIENWICNPLSKIWRTRRLNSPSAIWSKKINKYSITFKQDKRKMKLNIIPVKFMEHYANNNRLDNCSHTFKLIDNPCRFP